MRATFSRFNFLCLCLAPQSGKTFICFMYLYLFQVFLRPSFGACAPPSPNLTFYAYDFLRRVGRLPAMFQILSDDLSRHCVPLSPKGKAFYPGICAPLSPKGKAFLYIPKGKVFLYIMLIHILFCSVLFCSAIYFMNIVIWISIAPLYKTTSKFFHVKFFIVPLKLLDTLHKHGYNVECKIV